MRKTWYQTLVVETKASDDGLAAIRQVLAAYDVEIRDFDIKAGDGPGRSHIEFSVKLLNQQHQDEILQDLRSKGTAKAYWL
jgi:hypothetical protein